VPFAELVPILDSFNYEMNNLGSTMHSCIKTLKEVLSAEMDELEKKDSKGSKSKKH
jgi:hypothetical protein